MVDNSSVLKLIEILFNVKSIIYFTTALTVYVVYIMVEKIHDVISGWVRLKPHYSLR